MKLKLILAGMIAAVSVLAQAQEVKRADVRAEAKAANLAGEVAQGEADSKAPKQEKSNKSRAQVREETRAANKAGQIPAAEPDTTSAPKLEKSTKSRAQVREETKAAAKAGTIAPNGEK